MSTLAGLDTRRRNRKSNLRFWAARGNYTAVSNSGHESFVAQGFLGLTFSTLRLDRLLEIRYNIFVNFTSDSSVQAKSRSS